MPIGICEGPNGTFSHVESGTAVLIGASSHVEVKIEDLRFGFLFVVNSSISGQTVQQLGANDKLLTLGLVNFDSPLGISWESPVGSFHGKELRLALHVVTLGTIPTETRVFTYSFYLKEA